MMSVPVVETERLVLRGLRAEDFPAFAAAWADPKVTPFLTEDGGPRPRDESWKSFLSLAGQWSLFGFGTWIVEEKRTGRYLGNTGWLERNREAGTPLAGVPELGYTFAAEAHGKGYATEAAQAAMGWAKSHFGDIRVIAVIAPANIASLRVAEKCGFEEFARDTFRGKLCIFLDAYL